MTQKRETASALMASARRIAGQDKTKKRRKSQKTTTGASNSGWQEDVWDMYDLVGELHFLLNKLSSQVAKASLFVGQLDSDSDTPERVEDPQLATMMNELGQAQGGIEQLLKRLALNILVAGEAWLVGIPPESNPANPANADGNTDDTGENGATTDGSITDGILGRMRRIGANSNDAADDTADRRDLLADLDWYPLSVSEVSRSNTGTITLTLDEEIKRDFEDDEIELIRVWVSHPRRWWEADASTRSALPILKELVGLTMHVSAQIDSRLAGAGLLVVPQSAQDAMRRGSMDEYGDVSDSDEFTAALIESMLTPITDRASASAVVPLVATVPDEATDRFNYIGFSTPFDGEVRADREEAIRRLALSLDAPPELLLGTSDMNHWGGWLVQEETVSGHIVPVLETIANALTSQFLWPRLQEMGYSDEQIEKLVIWYDVSHLVTRPNLGSDAKDLYAAGVISDETLRRANGFDESDAPEDNMDRAGAQVLEMVRANPALLTSPGVKVLYEQVAALIEGHPLEAPEPPDDPSENNESDAEGDDTSEDVEDSAPADPTDADSEGDARAVPEQSGEAETPQQRLTPPSTSSDGGTR